MKGVLKKTTKPVMSGKTPSYHICVAFCCKISVDAMLQIAEPLEDKYDAYEDFFEDCFEKLSHIYGCYLPIQEMVSKCDFPDSLSEFDMHKVEMMNFLEREIFSARESKDLRKELALTELFEDGLCDKKKKEASQEQSPK